MLKAARELELERAEGVQYLPAERESRVSDFATEQNEEQGKPGDPPDED